MQIPILYGQQLIDWILTDPELANKGEWKSFVLNDNYAVSSSGDVVRGSYNVEYVNKRGTTICSTRDTKLLKQCVDSDGYPVVSIAINDELKTMHVHRVVALTFIPNLEGKPQVNHIDGNKQNNSISNLEWATVSENNRHAISTGLRLSVVPIKCLETGQVYESLAEASRCTGLVSETIRQSILHQFTTKEGYTFIKLDGSIQDEKVYYNKLRKEYLWRNDSRNEVPILCLDANLEFRSWAEAASWLNVDTGAIEYSIANKTACKGHIFIQKEYVLLDKQRYIDLCYTNSKFFKHLASKPTHSLYDRAIVLNSGGMDSTTCLSLAVAELGSENVCTVSVFYNQKHSKEISQAKAIADWFGVRHYEIDLSLLYKYSNCSLLSTSSEDIVDKSYADQIAENGEGKVATYVPFRNGMMLSAVAALAQSLFPNDYTAIYLGAHADDAAGEAYADCSPRFVNSMRKAIAIGTYNRVGVEAPFVRLSKADVCASGLKLGTPYHLTTSCYHGREKACGCCGTCIDRIAAFKANHAVDPIEYEIDIDWEV